MQFVFRADCDKRCQLWTCKLPACRRVNLINFLQRTPPFYFLTVIIIIVTFTYKIWIYWQGTMLNERGCLFLLLHSNFNWHANYEFFMMIISLNRTKGIIKMKEKMFCSSFRLHYWHERRQAGVVIAGTWLTMQQAFCFRSNNG